MVISKTVLGIVSFVSLSALALFLQPNGASDQEQLSSLQGEWVLETMTRGGVEIPPEQLFNERLVVESTQFARLQTKPNGEELRSETGRISVGLDEERKSIDFHLSQGTIYGVYEIKEGKLILCISREGGSRPDSLSSIQDDNRVLQQFVKSAKQTEVPTIESQHGTWTETWLKKIPSELPKDASDAKKWMEDHSFESILSGELTPEVAKKVNPDVKFEAYAQLKAKTYLFGKLTSKSKMATSPAIEVYCFVNELNEVVGMQVHPTKN